MSFDLYFVAKAPGQTGDDAVAALEELPDLPLTRDDLVVWQRLESGVRDVLPEAVSFEGERNRELTDDGSGIQILLFHGELSLSVPYWYSGPEAQSLIALLRRVVAIVEHVSGLTAYDPQAEAPFLGQGESTAPQTFEKVSQSFADRGITPGTGQLPPT